MREGQIVVSEGRSLVGTVSKTFSNYSWVTLITDPKSAVSAIVQESRAEGVVAGNYDASLNMEFVGQGAAVKTGRLRPHVGRWRGLSRRHRHRPRSDGEEDRPGSLPERERRSPREPLEHRAGARAHELRAAEAGAALMRYWTGAAIAFFLALLQASSIEQFSVLGVTPNLLLVLLVSWLVVRGLDDVLPNDRRRRASPSGSSGYKRRAWCCSRCCPIAGLGVLREMHIIHSDLLARVGIGRRGHRRLRDDHASPLHGFWRWTTMSQRPCGAP